MHVVTFYSFKGGVGRTTALVNVGIELALSGRRVLLVDFDLEAPGLDTFNLPRPTGPTPGIVDYVVQYLESGVAPEVENYVYRCAAVATEKWQVWIMPSGEQDESYEARLNSIDWHDLYAEREGYLLFENLKSQWEKFLAPDYVLIDSRSGHTDIGGICTRHLPDAVVLLFFPNEQNRRGLEKVVQKIREEEKGPRNKAIQLHFVMSNVPDLDDEEQILAESLGRMKNALQCDQLAATIHHYNSLNLLNQSVFALERPNSRLTHEYRELVQKIKQNNVEDRDGVLEFLKTVLVRMRRSRTDLPIATLDERLEEVRERHPADAEVLLTLARIRRRQRRIGEAITLLNQAFDAGARDPELFVARAEMRAFLGDQAAAIADIMQLLRIGEVSYFQLSSAIRLLRDLDQTALRELPASQALKALSKDVQFAIATELLASRESLAVAEEILRNLKRDESATVDQQRKNDVQLMVALIGQGRFREAREIIHPTRPAPGELGIQDAFNYAMAEWGETGAVPKDLFGRVVDIDRVERRTTANYSQCLAIALWAVGRKDEAEERIQKVQQQVMTSPHNEFSAWRYLQVSPEEFLEDLSAIRQMIEGQEMKPTVFSQASSIKETSK